MTRWLDWLVLSSVLAFGVPVVACAQPAPTPVPRESLRLRITNAPEGLIEASADGGRQWRTLGHVTHPALRVNPSSYTAASWACDSAIAATATNALHIKIAPNPASGRPMTLSIVPGGRTVGAATREPSSAIFTDIEAGTLIFGGGLGPYVNSPVLLAGEGPPRPLPAEYQPRQGDVLLIVRYEPTRLPLYATLENREGGTVEVDYGQGPVRVGVVDRPVGGIGRFEGTLSAPAGRIRANHPGVIDVSTSPLGLVGGFQIIPRHHASSPEMAYVATGHQWLIIGPEQAGDPDWAGQPPFFSSVILPSYRPDDLLGDHADWMRRVLSRTLVDVRYGTGNWEPMPRIAFVPKDRTNTEERSRRGRRGLWEIPAELNPNRPEAASVTEISNHALEGITAFRIVFPRNVFWPTDEEQAAP